MLHKMIAQQTCKASCLRDILVNGKAHGWNKVHLVLKKRENVPHNFVAASSLRESQPNMADIHRRRGKKTTNPLLWTICKYNIDGLHIAQVRFISWFILSSRPHCWTTPLFHCICHHNSGKIHEVIPLPVRNYATPRAGFFLKIRKERGLEDNRDKRYFIQVWQ